MDFNDRGVSPVIGIVVLVAIVVLLAGVLFVFSGSFAEDISNQPRPTSATVTLSESNAGVTASIERLSKPVEIRVNGERLYEINQSDVGREVLIPAAPGDRITVVATGEESSLILNRKVDKYDAGKFIAHYDFTSQSGTTAVDRSGNTNTLNITGASWESSSYGTGISLDGKDDYAIAEDLTIQNRESGTRS